MTKLLDEAFAVVRRPLSERQDVIAAAMIGLAERDEMPEDIDPGHLAAIERDEVAGDDEVAAAFRRFGA